jgi:hypothetical protein
VELKVQAGKSETLDDVHMLAEETAKTKTAFH